ncbi:hypothetical protein [Paenibacillus sedimenti]|uniref:Uncharacterized protein n=1 Tax=Paenibacillus sedimenti TaxID=2770274 RepID=A0A926QIK4_9BACL|nr:hypothetical protein [Paenibacillus sedimenti]MBD0379708.1 hypothetical protein [Paenibacillus sedimenti]
MSIERFEEGQFRRLAEIVKVMLSSGQILIITAQGVKEKELSALQTYIDEDKIECFWVGDVVHSYTDYNKTFHTNIDSETFTLHVNYLQEKGIIFGI